MKTQDMLDFADRYFSATLRGDIAALRQIYAADAVIWHNHDRCEIGVEDNLAIVQWFATTLPDQASEVIRREALPDGFFQQEMITATLPDGTPFSHGACVIVRVQDGKVVRMDEYLDSAEMQPLIALHALQIAQAPNE